MTGRLAGCATTLGSGAAPGTYPRTISGCTGLSSPDYTISYADAGVTVSRAALRVTASGGAMTYGSAPPAITASYAGFAHGDSAASLTTRPSCSTTATSASPVGRYPSRCNGAADPDYAISYASGTVTVDQAGTALAYGGRRKVPAGTGLVPEFHPRAADGRVVFLGRAGVPGGALDAVADQADRRGHAAPPDGQPGQVDMLAVAEPPRPTPSLRPSAPRSWACCLPARRLQAGRRSLGHHP